MPVSLLQLDPATLLFSTALLAFVMAAFAFSTARLLEDLRAPLRCWSLGMAGSGIAFLLYFQRGHIAWWLSFTGGNIAILLVAALLLRAQAMLVGARLSPRLMAAILAGGASGLLLATQDPARQQLGIASVSAALAAVALVYAHLMGRWPVARNLPGANVATLLGLLTAAALALRAALGLLGRALPMAMNATHPSTAHLSTLLTGALFIVGASLTFFAMVHEMHRRQTAERARRDGLTGLLTRRAFFDEAQRLVRGQAGARHAVAMVDIDHFKRVNDSHGHASGDRALQHVARLVAQCARGTDLVGRYGGEEFIVLLRDTELAAATHFGQRLVDAANRAPVRLANSGPLRCTLSVGVACLVQDAAPPDDAEATLDHAIVRADTALYDAKAQGRNRVCQAAPAAAAPR